MNAKHSVMFGFVSRLLSYVDSWSQHGRKEGWHGGKTERGDKRMLREPCCKCHFVLFKHFSECGDGHSRCSGSCHFLSHPLTFGILGSLPRAGTGSGMEDRGCFFISQGHSGRDGFKTIPVATSSQLHQTVLL